MCSVKTLVALGAVVLSLSVHADTGSFGRAATKAEIALWNIDVLPDGRGLPEGSGTVAEGEKLFATHCMACHGPGGEGGFKDRLVGGVGSLNSDHPIKTVGSYWPYATTVYDYIHRAMPYQAPGSLSDSDYYALVAYLLNRNAIVPDNASLDKHSLPAVKMPNRDGFVPEAEFRTIPVRR